MRVGYIPDPFGHIGQMPQILRGFGMQDAAFRRGLSVEPCEVYWYGTDGSRVLVAYLREGYDNAARLPTMEPQFTNAIRDLVERLRPHCQTSHILLMNGTDHHEPQPGISTLVPEADLETDSLRISTLPDYFREVREQLARDGTQIASVTGELRDARRHHLLAGVLSSRTWIKRRNDDCEILLERYAEPLCAWSKVIPRSGPERSVWTGHLAAPQLERTGEVLREAWRLLLRCHAHDSICGCSVDQVHKEMETRFDQVEQIGQELTRQKLVALAGELDTLHGAPSDARAALTVFNPTAVSISGISRARIELPAGLDPFAIVDGDGQEIPYRLLDQHRKSLADLELDGQGLAGMIDMIDEGKILGLSIQSAAIQCREHHTLIDVVVAEEAPPELQAVRLALDELERVMEESEHDRFRVVAHFANQITLEMLARDVPSFGLKTYFLIPTRTHRDQQRTSADRQIHNEALQVRVDPAGGIELSLLDSGQVYPDLIQIHDRAEIGDSYTHCPLPEDAQGSRLQSASEVICRRDALGEELEIQRVYRIPAQINPDRTARSSDSVELPMQIRLRLTKGVPRLDVHLWLENRAKDHRLQLVFPLGAPVTQGLYGGHFEIVPRSTALPTGGEDWAEQPVPEKPMRAFVAAQAGRRGLLVGARGLREASVSPSGEIAITLLRCFGWLSRDDLATRKGGAGPQVPVPGGQGLGEHVFDLSVIPLSGSMRAAVSQAEAFRSPLIAASVPISAGSLPAVTSLLRVEPSSIAITALKPAQEGEGLILRGVNLGGERALVEIHTHHPLAQAEWCRLDETRLSDLHVQPHEVRFPLERFEIATLRLTFSDQAD
jgi:alpha-mannosidase